MSGSQTPRRPPGGNSPGRPARAASGARPAAGNGDEGAPEFKRPRTVKMNPIVAIALFVTPVVLAGILVVLYINKPKPAERGPAEPVVSGKPDEYTLIKREIPRLMKLKNEAMALKDSDDAEAFKKKSDLALQEINKVIQRLDGHLDPVRDQDGQLPDAYAGYEDVHSQLRTMSHDLIKSSGF